MSTMPVAITMAAATRRRPESAPSQATPISAAKTTLV